MAGIYQKITPEKAKDLMESGAVVLDVRKESEYTEGHIKGAVLIPDSEIRATAPGILTDKARNVLVYCRSGRRSEKAARELVEMGYKNIYDFGGILSWPYETVSAFQKTQHDVHR